MADDQTLEMSLLSADGYLDLQDLFPVDAIPLPVVDDAGPMDTEPQSSPSEAPPQPKARTRTKFDAQAVSHLEVEFGMDQYPTAARRRVMAAKLAIPLIAIKNWFHNKRSRLRRQSQMAPKPKSPHSVLMYRQMSRSSVSTDSLSSPDYSPLGVPPLAKRFRTWSVEAAGLPSPQCVTRSPYADYYSSLGSSSSQSSYSSLGSFPLDGSSSLDSSSSLESSFLSPDSWSSYTLSSTTAYTSQSSSSGQSSLDSDLSPGMTFPDVFSPGMTFPEVFTPAVVHPQPSQSQADPPGALPCEDVFYGQDTPPSPVTPEEVFSPTPGGMFSPNPGMAQQVWYGDESYWLGLPPRDRLPAVSTVQDAGLSTLSRPRIDATSQPPTPLSSPRGQDTYPATPLPVLMGKGTYSDYGSPQTPTWLYCNSPWTPSQTTPDSVQDLLALQWLSPLLDPISSAWAWAPPTSDNYFQFPEVRPGGSVTGPSPHRDLDSDCSR